MILNYSNRYTNTSNWQLKMTFQTKLIFNQQQGKDLAVIGMNLPKETAERKEPGWSDRAFYLFKEFLLLKGDTPFRGEEFINYCYVNDCHAPEGTSQRVFAAIIIRAKKEGLIKHIGYTQTHDPKSHRANCSEWKKI